MMYIYHTVWIPVYEILRQYLHVAGKHNEVDAIAVEQLKLALLHLGLVVLGNRDDLKRYVKLLADNGEIRMIAYYDGNLHIPFAGDIPCKYVIQAMGHLGDEDGHALLVICEAQLIGEVVALSIQGVEIVAYFFGGYYEVLQIPLNPHVKYAVYPVNILVKIHNITPVGSYKFGDYRYNSRLVGAVHPQHGSIFILLFHLNNIF